MRIAPPDRWSAPANRRIDDTSAFRADTRITSNRAISSLTCAVSAMCPPPPSFRRLSPLVLREETAVQQHVTVAGGQLEAVVLSRPPRGERVRAHLSAEERGRDVHERGFLSGCHCVDEHVIETQFRSV